MTEEQRQHILDRQMKAWPIHLKGAEQGNPYATLCLACHGRHMPPRDEICPQKEKGAE